MSRTYLSGGPSNEIFEIRRGEHSFGPIVVDMMKEAAELTKTVKL